MAKRKRPSKPKRVIDEAVEARESAGYWLPTLEAWYAETRNPLHVWGAIAECINGRVPLPSWVEDYLYAVAMEFHRLTIADEEVVTTTRAGVIVSRVRKPSAVPRKNAIAKAVAKATGFIGGRGSANRFTEQERWLHGFMIAFDVYTRFAEIKMAGGWSKMRSIYDEVAAAHDKRCSTCGGKLGWKVVERHWLRHVDTLMPGARFLPKGQRRF